MSQYRTFITSKPQRALDPYGTIGGIYSFNAPSPEDNSWVPWDKFEDAVSLSSDDQGYPIFHGDFGEYRLAGLLIGSQVYSEKTGACISVLGDRPPFRLNDFLSFLWDIDSKAEKEGLLMFWPTPEYVTRRSLERYAERYKLAFENIDQAVSELKEAVQSCVDAEGEID